MHICKSTRGSGEDVVLLHGWGGCHRQHMQPIADMLSPRYRVTNIDLPGCGQSAWRPGLKHIDDFADALLAHLPPQAVYVGWSFGGLIAMSLTARYPQRVKRFVGIGATPRFVEDQDWPGVAKPGFSACFTQSDSSDFKTFMHDNYDREFADFDPKPAAYDHLCRMFEQSNLNMTVLQAGIKVCDDTDLREAFASVACPIDLILGGKDGALPVAQHAHIQTLNPNAVLHVIDDAGHLPFWTHPESFEQHLNQALARLI